jgi:ribonuclease J
LEAQGKRLLLDLGLPIGADYDDVGVHPELGGLDGRGDLLALIISHGHLDHVGLARLAGPDLTVAIGAATHRILKAAAPFVPRSYTPSKFTEFVDGQAMTFGPFVVTPILVDHSAYDAYAFLVEADGQRLMYSGDLRAHGRKARLFERLVNCPPTSVDAMLMEGSSLGRLDASKRFPTETDVENQLVATFLSTRGMVLTSASAQNIDRMVSIYRACKRSRRTLVLDLYAAEVLRATCNDHIPQSSWPGIAIFVPHYQRVRIKNSRRFDVLQRHQRSRIFGDALRHRPSDYVFLFRSAMLPDLERAECLDGAIAVWSQWDGYLSEPPGQALATDLEARHVPMVHAHTSGHASVPDLRRLAAAVAAKQLVPIHTFQPQAFKNLFGGNVVQRHDKVWWEV